MGMGDNKLDFKEIIGSEIGSTSELLTRDVPEN